MEVISYEEPRSWDDLGMDWNDPDPRDARYILALRNAFFERMAAPQEGYYTYSWNILHGLSPRKAVSAEALRRVIVELEYLCRFYYNLDPEVYKEDFSDFPRIMRLNDIVTQEDCEFFMNASYGAILDHGGEWLRKIKNAICCLHVVQCYRAWGTTLTRSGSEHDPPFDESIGKAFEYAFGDTQPSESEFRTRCRRASTRGAGTTTGNARAQTSRATPRTTRTATAATRSASPTASGAFAAG